MKLKVESRKIDLIPILHKLHSFSLCCDKLVSKLRIKV